MKTMKLNFFALMAVFAISFADVYAQDVPGTEQAQPQVKEDYTDEELKTFIQVNKSVAQVQQTAEQKMIQAIEEEEMDINRFNEIATAQQDPQADVEASDEEMQTFTKAAEKIMDVQRETQSEIAKVIESEGMEFTAYREIMMAYQNSPKVQEQVTKLVQEEQSQDQNQN